MKGRATLEVDVAVIGAGVVGCSVAQLLSHEALSVCVIERRNDVAEETSKSNTGVADSGWECEPGSLEAELANPGAPLRTRECVLDLVVF